MTRPSSFLTYSAGTLTLAAILLWIAGARISKPSPHNLGLASSLRNSAGGPESPATGKSVRARGTAEIARSYGNLPLSFEPNLGQADVRAQFIARRPSQTLFLAPSEAVVALKIDDQRDENRTREMTNDLTPLEMLLPAFLRPEVPRVGKEYGARSDGITLRMRLLGASQEGRGVGVDELPGTANYFIGKDPAKWITGLKTYSKVKFAQVYPGIDLVYYGNSQQLEYDFVVNPGSDPANIKLEFGGTDRLWVDKSSGDLVLVNGKHEVRLLKPLVYQVESEATAAGGEEAKHIVNGAYRVEGNRRVSFEIAEYDTSKTLIIDPVLSYFTYLGGMLPDFALRIALDSTGSAYVTGATVSPDFPKTNGVIATSYHMGVCGIRNVSTGNLKQFPCPDAFVTKLNPTGTAAVYSTFLGGTRSDFGISITVDSNGNAYVAGETESADFPVTQSGFQTTFLFPTTDRHPPSSAFLAKLNPSGSQLLYSTYLQSTQGTLVSDVDDSFASAVAADDFGKAYVVGYTRSPNFPTTTGVVQASLDGVACRYSVGSSDVGAAGGAGSASVAASTGCSWSATSNAPWITITSGGSGSGNGTVNYSIAANSGVLRNGSITIGGRDFLITQQNNVNSCVTSISPTFNIYPAGGVTPGSGFFFNVTAPSSCSWTASSDVPWITTSGNSGSGNGTVFISAVAPNSGLPRFGEINIGGLVAGASQNAVCGPENCSDGFVSKIDTNASGAASLVYSTYLGGNNFDAATGVAVDSVGNAYVSGTTLSSNFAVANAFQSSAKGGTCGPPGRHVCASAFVAKLNPNATALQFSTYLGGSADSAATAIAVDPAGNAYVTGFTNSSDFPVSGGVAQSTLASASCTFGAVSLECPDGFVAKFSPSGSRIYSTYLGGTGADLGFGIAADAQGDAFITGTTNSTNFPTASPVQANAGGGNCSFRSVGGAPLSFSCPDVFVSELNPAGTTLLFSTYLGGNSADIGTGIALDTSTNPNGILVTGATLSPGLATAGVLQSAPGGMGDAFVAKLASAQPDFSISAATGGSTSATVNAGQTATYNLQVTPSGGFTGSVSVACSGAPAHATCTASASSVNVTGTSSVPFSVTVPTMARGLLPPSPFNHPIPLVWYVLLILLTSFLAIVYRMERASRPEKRRYAWAFAGVLLACLASMASGCGSGGGGGGGNNGTPMGTYTLTVNGVNQGINHSLSLTLTVN